MTLRVMLALLIATVAGGVAFGAERNASVEQFSPQGTVNQVRQVTARFSEPMVPLGDPRATQSPFDIDCAARGAGRWIDSRSWSYDFEHDLPGGTRCTFTLRPGLKTLAGATIGGTRKFSFDTGGPAIADSRPYDGETIEEDQAFVLVLDTTAKEQTILDHVSFSVEGLPQRVGAKIVQGADRGAILKRFRRMIDKHPVVILQAKQRFPANTKVSLVWGAGIQATTGVATTQDHLLNFKTRKAFQSIFRCERENRSAGCIPLLEMTLEFSAPIRLQDANRVVMIAPDSKRIAPKIADKEQIQRLTFEPPFKESAQYRIEIPRGIIDEAGRKLSNESRFPMTVTTDEFPPLAKFQARFGIIESIDPVLPVTVRNLEAQIAAERLDAGEASVPAGLRGLVTQVEATLWRLPRPDASSTLQWLLKVAAAKRADSVFAGAANPGVKSFAIPKPNGAKAFEVMGIPLKRPGLYVVELKSERLGSVLLGVPKPMYVPAAALVTNLAVHFKRGYDNSLIWVTTLETAQPVAGARVAVADCNGTELWSGATDARGLAMVPQIDDVIHPPTCRRIDYYGEQGAAIGQMNSGLLVTASHGDDFSFVHTSWQNGIEPWRFHLPTDYQPSPFAANTVFDRTLFRAGETVHMKHFLRNKTVSGFAITDASELPTSMSIRFLAGDQHYEFPLAWNGSGIAENEWTIPKEAKLGMYQVMLARKPKGPTPTPGGDYLEPSNDEWQSGTFQVEQFRIPLMRASIRIPPGPQVGVTSIPLDLSAEYLSGGPAKLLPVTLRSQITKNAMPSFPDFEDFAFANGIVKEGVVQSPSYEETEEVEERPGVHQRKDLTLDDSGGAQTEITDIPREPTPLAVRAEMEYRDPTGESQTVANTITVFPAKRLVGILGDGWVSSPGSLRPHVAVVDDAGKPIANAAVRVDLFTRKYYSYRTRIVGGFYSYNNTAETKRIGQFCAGDTDAHGLLVCQAKAPVTGDVIVQATVTDDAGNSCSANTQMFVPGKEQSWSEARDEDRIDVLPEKPQYEPGDVARFQVRSPFAEATALVTVEREGIVAASLVHLSGKNPVISIPVRDYAPNVFVSVLAVRGRMSSVQPTAMLDLGKPAFKLGIAEIRVGWREHRLAVKVTPERAVYHVREKARVKVAVVMPDGRPPPAGSNVAIAAVDEGLLELKPNDSWKLLDAMMGRRSYQVETSAAELQVVGKRHYGLKALPPGGGGGKRVTRELFDTLLLWAPNVPLDSKGEAIVEVPLNDSLTSFKIAAIAGVGAGMFGSGSGSIRSTQDLMLFSGVSPIIRTGDSFGAEFTVRNASESPLDVTVTSRIDGVAAHQQPQKLRLGPGDGKAIAWDVAVPPGVSALKYRVDAVAAQGPQDHLAITQSVLPAVPVETLQATLAQLEKPIAQPVAIPLDAFKGEGGGIQVMLSASLAASLDGVHDWMLVYPYSCLEQRVSRAVALHDEKLWAGIVNDLPSYTDADGLLKYFPLMPYGSDVLTSYVLALSNEAGFMIPPASEADIERGLTAFIEGKLTPKQWVISADLPLRKISAIEALSRIGRAVPSMLASITIEPNLWPDSTVIDWWSIVNRVGSIPNRQERATEAERILRARLNSQGTALHLASDPRSSLWWLMVTPARNMARLLLVALNANVWHEDLPRLSRGLLQLQSHGSWDSTVANAWGTLAIDKFVHAFESTPVSGISTGTIGSITRKLDWSHDPKGGMLQFDWPPSTADLNLTHGGTGKPWAEIRARAAIPLRAAFSSGYKITKTITAVEQHRGSGWKRGDLVRVHLKIDAQTDMTWVVINDPIPAGASQLGSGLQRESQIATSSEAPLYEQEVWPAFVERPFDSYRAYYEYVPKCSFETEYTIRLNQAGKFGLPPTRVDALYEPEMFGELPNSVFEVGP